MSDAQMRGQRLSWTSDKLGPLLRLLEAVRDAVPTNEPTAFCFSPQGLQIVVWFHNTDYRFHVLSLDKSYFFSYHCLKPFQVYLKLKHITDHLSKTERTHKARCIKMEDDPSGQFFLSAVNDEGKGMGAEKGLNPCKIENITFRQNLHRARPIHRTLPYLRYPFTILLKTQWLHGVFKGLEKTGHVKIQLDGKARRLSVHTIVDGAPTVEHVPIPANHILRNPFLPSSASPAKSQVLLMNPNQPTMAVHATPSTSPSTIEDEFDNFQYMATFMPRDLWIAVKRPRVETYARLYMAPGNPLIVQFLLSENESDPNAQSYYSSWNAPIERDEINPLVSVDPSALTDAVKQEMVERALAEHPGETDPNRISKIMVAEIDRFVKAEEKKKLEQMNQMLLQQQQQLKVSSSSTESDMKRDKTNDVQQEKNPNTLPSEDGQKPKPNKRKRKVPETTTTTNDNGSNVPKKRGRPRKNPTSKP